MSISPQFGDVTPKILAFFFCNLSSTSVFYVGFCFTSKYIQTGNVSQQAKIQSASQLPYN